MSATTKLDLDQAWTAFSVASTRIEGGKVHVYDETLPDEAAPKVRRGRTRSPA